MPCPLRPPPGHYSPLHLTTSPHAHPGCQRHQQLTTPCSTAITTVPPARYPFQLKLSTTCYSSIRRKAPPSAMATSGAGGPCQGRVSAPTPVPTAPGAPGPSRLAYALATPIHGPPPARGRRGPWCTPRVSPLFRWHTWPRGRVDGMQGIPPMTPCMPSPLTTPPTPPTQPIPLPALPSIPPAR
jgi:hypothetical protein